MAQLARQMQTRHVTEGAQPLGFHRTRCASQIERCNQARSRRLGRSASVINQRRRSPANADTHWAFRRGDAARGSADATCSASPRGGGWRRKRVSTASRASGSACAGFTEAGQAWAARARQRPELPVPAAHEDRTALRELGWALDRLPPDQREVLFMIVLQEKSYEAAAKVTGCAIGTLKSRVHRARLQLRAFLTGEETPDVA
jgi:RNA polymerase sigma factor (sigma-70 family)